MGFESDDCFTWSNGNVFEILDRLFGNVGWLETFPDFSVKHLEFFCSDHKPLLLSFGNNASGSHYVKVKRVSRFHFEHAWCEDPGCGDIISSNLALQVIWGFLVCWIILIVVGLSWQGGVDKNS